MAEPAAVEPAPRVDAHAHIFTRAMPFAEDAHSTPDYDYAVESYLADLDTYGIDYGVIAAASLYGENNAYTLAALRQYPRLRGTVIVSPRSDFATLQKMADQGVVGVRLQWRRTDQFPDLREEPYRSLLKRMADCGLHAELLAKGEQLPLLLPGFAETGVRIVIDHFGAPPRDPTQRAAGLDAIGQAAERADLWVKLSAGFRIPYDIAAECTDRLLGSIGPDRLLWGSDAPFVNHENSASFEDALALYTRLVPNAATRQAIDEAAMKLFFQ
ncbi:amidohydrolase family protein [Parasphingopyxis marina]|uniref:Amidohydrolase family protein n=1 Tax=Parasphingopyxis marina TaxID=2761622 RepID=A0A842I298_9SPHN|nr:amidohydrolase family protein [Parasphingopyxis marina]MBC2778853.1 amidohydrolase family protein [Parasphingopyxis marina]